MQAQQYPPRAANRQARLGASKCQVAALCRLGERVYTATQVIEQALSRRLPRLPKELLGIEILRAYATCESFIAIHVPNHH